MTFNIIAKQFVLVYKDFRKRFFRFSACDSAQIIRNIEAIILIAAIFLLSFFSFPERTTSTLHSLRSIQQEKEIHIGVLLNPMEYYVRNGSVGGFAHEMGNILSDSLQVKVVYHVFYTYEDVQLALLQNEIDLMAVLETPSPEGTAFFSYTLPFFYSDVVCLQAKTLPVDSIQDFGFVANASFKHSAALLKKSHPQWQFHQYRSSADQLLDAVNKGKLNATLSLRIHWCSYASLYPHLRCAETLQDSIPLCWAVRHGNDSLLLEINKFIRNFCGKKNFHILCRKYTHPNISERRLMAKHSQTMSSGSISRYDEELKTYSAKYQLDWKLLAAIIYQESKFNCRAVGKGNTFGLMQFTPATGTRYGVRAESSAERQIKGGCRYVSALSRKIEKYGVTDSAQRIPMVIAAYNAGSGHIEDALLLAKSEKNLDHTQWEGGVKEALLLLGEHRYYRKPVVKHGSYHGGRHTLRYVQSVTNHFEHYKALGQRDSLVEII